MYSEGIHVLDEKEEYIKDFKELYEKEILDYFEKKKARTINTINNMETYPNSYQHFLTEYGFYSAHNREIVRRSEEHTSELQSRGHLVCRLLLEKKNTYKMH